MDPYSTKSALQRILKAGAEAFRPQERHLPSEWVELYRRHSGEANARSHGRWRNFPMQVEPMDSVVDPTVRTTVLMWAAQTGGKTEVLNGIVGYFIHQEPSPILYLHPDLNMAEAVSKDRIAPFIENTPVLAQLVTNRSRNSGNTILHKTFPGGHLTLAGANSPASLASRPIRVNLNDEIDRYPESAGKEGDPCDLAEKRTDTFPTAINFRTSTPTIRKKSRIEKEFEMSDKRYWFVRCWKCKCEQTLKWKQVKWTDEDSLEDTWYECEIADCKAHWTENQRIKSIINGRWVATAKFKGVRGYHLNGLYNLHPAKKGFVSRLHQFPVDFLASKRKGKESLKVWTNTFLAETWEEEADVKPEWTKLYERREKYNPLQGKIPNGVRLITFGTDFQADRIELEFVGWGAGEESWGLGHHKIYGDPRLPTIYKDLETRLIQQFTREDGVVLTPNAGGFDTGYAGCQRQLYAWLRPRLGRRYYAFKGSSQKNSEPISHSAKSKVESVRLIMVGTNRIKSYIYSRASLAVEGPGYMHYADCEGYDAEYFKQLLVEDSVTEAVQGVIYKVFSMPSIIVEGGTDRNEAIDLRVYAHGALYARGVPNWDFEERRNLARKPVELEEGESEPTLAPSKRKKDRRARRNQFMQALLG